LISKTAKGATAVIKNEIVSANPNDPLSQQIFLYNNIVYSFVNAESIFSTNKYGDHIAYKSVNNELLALRYLEKIKSPELSRIATVIVDYRGFRVLAQSMIPGIFTSSQERNMPYGVEESEEVPSENDTNLEQTETKEEEEKIEIKEKTETKEKTEKKRYKRKN